MGGGVGNTVLFSLSQAWTDYIKSFFKTLKKTKTLGTCYWSIEMNQDPIWEQVAYDVHF